MRPKNSNSWTAARLLLVFGLCWLAVPANCIEMDEPSAAITGTAASFQWVGKIAGYGLPEFPKIAWAVNIGARLQRDYVTGQTRTRLYSIRLVSLEMPFDYRAVDDEAPPNSISEHFKVTLTTANFDPHAFSLTDVAAYNCSFICDSEDLSGTGAHVFTIFLKYNQTSTYTTPAGSTLSLGGKRNDALGGFWIYHVYVSDPEPPLGVGFWPGGTTLKPPAGYDIPGINSDNSIPSLLESEFLSLSAVFKEHGTRYGWDDFTDFDNPWKSVRNKYSDTVLAEITPAWSHARCLFESQKEAYIKASPKAARSGNQIVTIKGVDIGDSSEVWAKDAKDNSILATLNAVAYNMPPRRTVAVTLVHENNTGPDDPGYRSTNIPDGEIRKMLKKVFKQAVVQFALIRRPPKTVDFDVNPKDGMLDVNSWMSPEMEIIRDACKTKYDYDIFIVSKPSDGSTGFMWANQKYGFVHTDTGGTARTVCHELGHGAGGLEHRNGDFDNIMCQGPQITWRLRKDQWDTLNSRLTLPKTEDRMLEMPENEIERLSLGVQSMSIHMRNHSVGKLLGILSSSREIAVSQGAKHNIEKAFRNDVNRDTILLAGLADIGSLSDEIYALARLPLQEPKAGRFWGVKEWAANLVLARKGDIASIANLLEFSQTQDLHTQVVIVLGDLQYVPQPEVVEFLRRYLDSNERLQPVKSTVEGIPVANYAASSLARILEGFPVSYKEDYSYSEEEIRICRQWMSEQKEWIFR